MRLKAVGLTLFFIGTLITHAAHDLSLGNRVRVVFLVVVLAAPVLGIYGGGHRYKRDRAGGKTGRTRRVEAGRPVPILKLARNVKTGASVCL